MTAHPLRRLDMLLARSITRVAAVAAMIAVFLVACGAGASPSAGSMRAEGAWARPSMGMDRAGAVYLSLINETGTADALVGAETTAATTVEVHETTADASGQMAMHPVEKVELPAGGRVELAPGGFHIMLIGLTGELTAGQEIELTLHFEHAPDLVVKAAIRMS
jgi:hypothetical protein